MTLKYGNKSVPFGCNYHSHGENKMAAFVAETWSGLSDWTPQSGNYRLPWGNDKNSNWIVDYKASCSLPLFLNLAEPADKQSVAMNNRL